MASPLTSAVEGFQAAQEAGGRAMMANLEQQRIDLEQRRTDTELKRQSNLDKLSVLQDQANSIAGQARPHLAYLNSPPVDPTKDPEGYQKWLDSPEYKQHASAAEDLDNQVGDIRKQKQKVQNDIIGIHVGQTMDQAKQDMAEVMGGTRSIHDLPPERVTDIFSLKSQMDPSMFVADPKTGRMPIDQLNDTIQNGVQNNDWTDPGYPPGAGPKAHALASLSPHLQMAMNHPLAGGTVTGVSVMDAKIADDGKIHFRPIYKVHMPDGTDKDVPGPEGDQSMPDSIERLGKRAALLQQMAELAKHPDLQAKIQQSFQDQTSMFHRLNNDLLGAGIPQNELLPAPYTTAEVPRGGKLIFKDAAGRPVMGNDGKPLTIEGNEYTSTASQREDLADQLQQQNPSMSREEAVSRASWALNHQQYHGGRVDYDSTPQAAAGRGAAATKYSPADKAEYERNLSQAVAERFGADLTDLDPKEDAINRLPKDKQLEARQMFNGARVKLRNDMRRGKEVDPEDYLPKQDKPAAQEPAAQADSIRADFQSGKLTREQARQKLQQLIATHGVGAQAKKAPAQTARAAAAAVASNTPNPAKAAQDQGAAIRSLALPVNIGDYVQRNDIGAGKPRNLDADIKSANETIQQLQGTMGDASLPENVREDMQHRFAAELMRKNELMALKAKFGGVNG